MRNRGITLIALVITIIVLLILAGVSLSLVAGSDGILSKAGKAVEKNKTASAKEIAELVIMDVQADYYDDTYVEGSYAQGKVEYITEKLQLGMTSGDYFVKVEEGKVKVYKESGSELGIVASGTLEESGKVKWDDEPEGGTIPNPGKPSGSTPGKTESSKNRTLANTTTGYSYKNPVIPQGFQAVDTESAVWSYTDAAKTEVAGWNEGLVIEDVNNQNQFVWVPVDGTEVPYAKWCTIGYNGLSYTSCSDDTSVYPVSDETAQINAYGGFYVARYEAGLASTTQSTSTNNISTVAPVSKAGEKVWTHIDYNHATQVAKLMVNEEEKYGNNKSGLITGKQWDTIMKWYQNAGIKVDTAQDWGSYYNLGYSGSGNYFTYDSRNYTVSEWKNGSFVHIANDKVNYYHGSGLNSNGIKKNIADLGGNIYEWTTEVYENRRIMRGAEAGETTNSPVSLRVASDVNRIDERAGFRATLYIQ